MTTGFIPSPAGWWIYKDPQAKLPYGVSWADWLDAADTIASVVWAISPSGGLTVNTGKSGVSGAVATAFLEGGEVGATYTVTCHVVTTAGFEDDRSFEVRCKQR